MGEKNNGEEGSFKQQSLVPDFEGRVFIDDSVNDHPERKKESNYPKLKTESGKFKFEKKEENLVSFKKETEIHAYSRGLRRYVPHLLKNNINAYIVGDDIKRGRWYCFEENLDEQTNKANLISRGYPETLDRNSPYFYAKKSQEKKAKPSNRIVF